MFAFTKVALLLLSAMDGIWDGIVGYLTSHEVKFIHRACEVRFISALVSAKSITNSVIKVKNKNK